MGERVYSVVIAGALGMIKSMRWPVTVVGGEHVPASGPAILASNHIGYLDFVFGGYAAREQGRRVRFLAKKEIFDKGGVGWFMRQMGHIPVDRHGAADASVRAAVTALQAGEVIGMFPEATISPSFVPRKGKTGTVRAARETGAPIIPVAVWGTQRILTKWRPRNFKRNIPIVVVVGEPLEMIEGEDAEAATTRLMARITELLEHAQRIYPAKPRGDADRWWLPAHLGGAAPTFEEAERRLAEEQAARKARRASEGPPR
ncbi:MAG TPA: lysophospholipid acyltransferase family protein [Actinomycetota bacterium]|nr:lysophospholipid acyltransferase family protein [Actinomycetota bacterium]